MLTPTVFLLIGLVAAGSFGAMVIIFSRLLRNSSQAAFDPNQAPATPLRLQPINRLLAEDDFDFLGRQPGFNPKIAARLRARRVAIFKSYLNQLEAEFARLHRALRLLTLMAGHDRPEIAQVLFQQRVQFTFRIWEARVRLMLFGMGVRPADLSGVTEAVQQLRERLQSMQLPVQVSPTAA